MEGSAIKRLTSGWRVIKWIETHCVFTKGEWIGKPFKLLPWQKRLILALFELDPETRLRRYRWALIGVPKKNGKTELAAALALYFLIGDGEPSAIIACAASSDNQADLVFGAAKTMATMSPTLKLVCEVYEREIHVPSSPGSKLVRVAAVGGANDGENWHVVICDELHEWVGDKGEKVWNVLTNGTGARRQPLVLQITTAGYDRNTVCYRQYKYGVKVRDGKIKDHTYFFLWIEAPKDADWRDPKTWEVANPSYGVTVRRPFFEDQVKRKPENVFRRYFLNQWTQAAESWLPSISWIRNTRPRIIIPEGSGVFLGVDIGIVHDASAVAWVHRVVPSRWKEYKLPSKDRKLAEDASGLYLVQFKIWTPPGDGTELELALIEHYIGGGGDTLPGGETPLAERFYIEAIGYDPHMFTGEAQRLSERFTMVKHSQTDEYMSPATKTARELIMANRVKHDGDEDVEEHVMSGVLRQTDRGYRLSKRKATGRTDACVAMVLALDLAAGEDESCGFDPGD